MKKTYTLPEKQFICDYHPEIVVDSVELEPFFGSQIDGESPALMCCFATEEAADAYENFDANCEGVYLRIKFHDEGHNSFAQRYVEFADFAEVRGIKNFEGGYSDYCPGIAYPKMLRDGESVTVSVPFIIRKRDDDDDSPELIELLRESGALIQVNKMVVSNPFVGMAFSFDAVVEEENGFVDTEVVMRDIEYFICPDPEKCDAVDGDPKKEGDELCQEGEDNNLNGDLS